MAKKGTTMNPADLHSTGSNSAVTLLSGIETIESLESEKDDISTRIKDEKAALKDTGFDMKIINAVIRRRRQDRDEVEEQDNLIETYERALEEAAEHRRLAETLRTKGK